jgi:hypothetical protein
MRLLCVIEQPTDILPARTHRRLPRPLPRARAAAFRRSTIVGPDDLRIGALMDACARKSRQK